MRTPPPPLVLLDRLRPRSDRPAHGQARVRGTVRAAGHRRRDDRAPDGFGTRTRSVPETPATNGTPGADTQDLRRRCRPAADPGRGGTVGAPPLIPPAVSRVQSSA